MCVSTIRFAARGWITALYIDPPYHFHYWGFAWVEPLPAAGLFLVFAALGVLSLLVAAGLWYRPALALFFLLFTYVELLDAAAYLSPSSFISALALLMLALPLRRGLTLAPTWALWALRLQVGLVYVFAGLAKLRPDWLLQG